ncbi:MAG: tautomerase family protein [Caldimicrobium sp.]
MPVVKISLFTGRDKEIKKKIAQDITEILVKNLNISPEAVIILFEDLEKHNFYQAGKSGEDLS